MSKKVLIVDDDKLIADSVSALCRQAGYEVLIAPEGQQGLALAVSTHPDLVITDIRMPIMDGLSMLEQLRADEQGKNIPVIVFTNDETTDAINQALTSGVTVYLSKINLDPETLSQQIRTALGD